jgi:hypothetical protein
MSIVLTTTSGPDSKLHLEIPVNEPGVEFEVEINIRTPHAQRKKLTTKEWAAIVESLAGSITDPTFERPPQLPLEEREPLS